MITAFYITAGISLLGALGAVTSRNVVHAVLWLMLFSTGLAGVFVTLGAEFLAVVQVLVHVGAVGILALFVVMLTRQVTHEVELGSRGWQLGVGIALLLGGVLVAGLRMHFADAATFPETGGLTARALGRELMGGQAVAFELTGVLLTVALVGALLIARNSESGDGKS